MIFLGYFLIYVVRNNLSVHIVDMAQVMLRDDDLLDIESVAKRRSAKRTGVLRSLIGDIV